MELIIKVFVISMVTATIVLLLKKNSPEMSLLIVVAACATILSAAFFILKDIIELLKEISLAAEIEPAAVSMVIKSVGIGIVSKFASDVCNDAGQTAAASSVELFGSVAVIYIALPLIKTVIKNINSLI